MSEPTMPAAGVSPQSLEAEEQVLGACLLSPRALEAAIEGLEPEDFFRGSHGLIFRAMRSMFEDDVAVDAVTLIDQLEQGRDGGGQSPLDAVGGQARVHELARLVPATANVRHYARIVRDAAVLRRLAAAGFELRRLADERPGDTEELLDAAEAAVFALRAHRDEGSFVSASDVLKLALERLRELHESGSSLTGVPSGWKSLDDVTAGFQPGNLVVLAARPSVGKTSMGLGIIAHVTMHLAPAVPVALFTLEMSRAEIVQRLLQSEGFVESQKLRTGRLETEDWSRIHSVAEKVDKAPLYIDDAGAVSINQLRSSARRMKMRHPNLGLVVVDYLQLMGSGAFDNRVQEVSQISRTLKHLARELDVPVLALSQLSRAVEQRHDKRPMLSDIRESGSVEQDADLVMFLYRDEYYHPEDTENAGICEVNVAKHRNGPTLTVKLSFVKRYARFSELALPGDVGTVR